MISPSNYMIRSDFAGRCFIAISHNIFWPLLLKNHGAYSGARWARYLLFVVKLEKRTLFRDAAYRKIFCLEAIKLNGHNIKPSSQTSSVKITTAEYTDRWGFWENSHFDWASKMPVWWSPEKKGSTDRPQWWRSVKLPVTDCSLWGIPWLW